MNLARAYLSQFYQGDLTPASKAMLQFYASVYKDLQGASYLEFGGGPTIYSLITAAKTCGSIHFTDYNIDCLTEVNHWHIGTHDAFDWSHFTCYALSCENADQQNPTKTCIQKRHELIRQRLQKISQCNIFADDPLLGSSKAPYDVISNNSCLTCVTDDFNEWILFNKKLTDLLSDGGLFVSVTPINASFWDVQGIRYPSVRLNPKNVIDVYNTLGLSIDDCEQIYQPQDEVSDFDGFMMISGRKKF
ncbi:MAG: guanitoxin biosynthesis pre-guanitoxin forming N-methyltransferase GntF [Chloroflexota bacterium]